MARPLNIALIGYSFMGKAHSHAYRDLSMFFPDTGVEGGVIAAEKVRSALANMRVEFEGNTHQVTATFGVVAVDPGSDLDRSIQLADEALYRGKEAGRNRVVPG